MLSAAMILFAALLLLFAVFALLNATLVETTRVKELSGIAEVLITAFAIIAGGIFAYYKLQLFRDFEPHLTISHAVSHRWPLQVEAMEIAGNSTAETSTAFLQQLRENHPGPLVVIWDNGPAYRGEAIRSYLATPDLHLRLVALPAYSPDFNADEAVWDWAREEVTANECLGTKAKVQEKMYVFFGGLAHRKDEVKHRCRTLLQARADALMMKTATPLPSLQNVVPTLALV